MAEKASNNFKKGFGPNQGGRKINFIKLGESYINLDNVTIIQPHENHSDYVVLFAGQNNCCLISAADMADIRSELEKVKKLQDLDKIVFKTNEKIQKEVNALFEKQEKFNG